MRTCMDLQNQNIIAIMFLLNEDFTYNNAQPNRFVYRSL